MVRSLLFCLTLCALLTGCEEPEIREVIRPVPVSVHVPQYLRECPTPPKPQVTDTARQSDVSDYLLRLYGVASQCHTKLDAVDDILSKQEAEERLAAGPR